MAKKTSRKKSGGTQGGRKAAGSKASQRSGSSAKSGKSRSKATTGGKAPTTKKKSKKKKTSTAARSKAKSKAAAAKSKSKSKKKTSAAAAKAKSGKTVVKKKPAAAKSVKSSSSKKKAETTKKSAAAASKSTKSKKSEAKVSSSKAPPTAAAADAPTKPAPKKKAASTPRKRSSSAIVGRPRKKPAVEKELIPDKDGYVMYNGRRVRMISTKNMEIKKKTRKSPAASAATDAAATPAVDDKPVKTRLKKKDLERFRDRLLEERARMLGNLSSMESQALQSNGGNLSNMPIHMADVGSDVYEQDFMLGMAENERTVIREIDQALQRIEDGTYGVCALTRKPIPKARLNAKPWAKYTIEAARMVENGQVG